MSLLGDLFKSKEERERDRRAQEAIRRADDVIARTEKLLEDMQRDDQRWKL